MDGMETEKLRNNCASQRGTDVGEALRAPGSSVHQPIRVPTKYGKLFERSSVKGLGRWTVVNQRCTGCRVHSDQGIMPAVMYGRAEYGTA